jgi:arsenate reductase (glutaredoxin)
MFPIRNLMYVNPNFMLIIFYMMSGKAAIVRAMRLDGMAASVWEARMILYGIRNCDTVRKARAWLDARGAAYDFHDYKIAGIDEPRLRAWISELGWERLLNRAGTTFRKLPDAAKEGLDADKAVALMLAQPSMIRRPLLDLGGRRLVGFDEGAWAAALAGTKRTSGD